MLALFMRVAFLLCHAIFWHPLMSVENAFHARLILSLDAHHWVIYVVCACYFSPLSTSFIFHALNVIRFSCVGLCGPMRHSCDRALIKRPCHTSTAKARNECHFLASVDMRFVSVLSCAWTFIIQRCACFVFVFCSFVNVIRF